MNAIAFLWPVNTASDENTTVGGDVLWDTRLKLEFAKRAPDYIC